MPDQAPVEQARAVPDWTHAPLAWCGEPERAGPDCGGGLEVWSEELTQPVLAECLLPHSKCEALAQDALGCARALAIQFVELAQDMRDRGGVLETRSVEPAHPVLAE